MMMTADDHNNHSSMSKSYEIDWGDSERDSGSSADVESFTKDHHYMAAGAQYQVTVLYCYASSSISNCSCAEDVNFIHIPIPGDEYECIVSYRCAGSFFLPLF